MKGSARISCQVASSLQGSIALRVRRATDYDVEFMDNFKNQTKKKKDLYYFSNKKGGAGALKSLTTVYKKKGLFPWYL